MSYKVVWISDFDMRGSGYKNLSVPLCEGLVDLGNEVIVAGLGYSGEEHSHNFSIIPARGIKEAVMILYNLIQFWNFDVLIVALDIPLQDRLLATLQPRPFSYIGIMPIEADPLSMSASITLTSMDKPFIISDFGEYEAKQSGVMNAEHLIVGIDRKTWRPVTDKKRISARGSLGIQNDEYFILTVADNQERKNLSRSLEIIKEVIDRGHDIKWGVVTREHHAFGWNLRDYAVELGISSQVMIFERGMELKKLWMIYAAADVFLLSSKAEGAGLPVLEAMACGIPVVATNCTALRDHLSDGRGYLIDTINQDGKDYDYRDPFLNGRRYIAKISSGADQVIRALKNNNFDIIKKAHKYIDNRDWNLSILRLDEVIRDVIKSK